MILVENSYPETLLTINYVNRKPGLMETLHLYRAGQFSF